MSSKMYTKSCISIKHTISKCTNGTYIVSTLHCFIYMYMYNAHLIFALLYLLVDKYIHFDPARDFLDFQSKF